MGLNEYNDKYFLTANPNIYENEKLRDPQKTGFYKVYDHFVVKNKKTHAIVVLPTGVGKTGLIGLLPFHICKGRLLIITPQLTIKDTVVDSLDPDNPLSFWYKRNIFQKIEDTPVVVEYDSSTTKEVLDSANLVILNIQKLQSRLAKSPLNFLSEHYFDMIIIDEAHHSPANTWVATIEHFKKAKVVKVTGTPIRTDGVELAGELVYKYKLSQAMAKGYIKSLRNFEYVPDELRLTIDNDESKEYTVDELLIQGIRDEEWIRRSVAYSTACSTSVVDASLKLLNDKRRNGSKVPHKIIAVACSIEHAEKIKQLYLEKGYKAEVIHSKQDLNLQKQIKKDIENHRIDVIINVAMLGEGYDHPYLSVAAIFRPFRSELPYEQFIGRILRSIPQEETDKIDDNIADVVSHTNLELAHLWEKYKVELQESEVIKHLQEKNVLDFDNDESKKDEDSNKIGKVIPLGDVKEIGNGSMTEDVFLTTELIKMHREEEKKQKEDIKQLQQLLGIEFEQALSIYNQTKTKDTAAIKRPDLYFSSRKRNLDTEIREIIVPEIITKYNIVQSEDNLKGCRLFNGRYSWIKNKAPDNGGLLALFLNAYMKNEVGKPREMWTTSDYDNAFNKLPVVKEYIEKIIIDYL